MIAWIWGTATPNTRHSPRKGKPCLHWASGEGTGACRGEVAPTKKQRVDEDVQTDAFEPQHYELETPMSLQLIYHVEADNCQAYNLLIKGFTRHTEKYTADRVFAALALLEKKGYVMKFGEDLSDIVASLVSDITYQEYYDEDDDDEPVRDIEFHVEKEERKQTTLHVVCT